MDSRSNSNEAAGTRALAKVLADHADELLNEWVATQQQVFSARGVISAAELRAQSSEFLRILRTGIEGGDLSTEAAAWRSAKEFLAGVSRSRALQGFTPTETALFVFSLKEPLFGYTRRAHLGNAEELVSAMMISSRVLDDLGLFTTEVYVQSREELISRQQADMLELSTPVVSLWDGVLALPMIGTLDSSRTQVVMETLLQRIVETGADIAVIDITGVPTVDTLTAQHLLKTVTAARLMGAECIISGIRPQIAQTIVHLGVDLGGITTKASLADAFKLALQRSGRAVVRVSATASGNNAASPTPRG